VITWLKNSRCTNHLKSILYSLLQVLDITDFCRINSRLSMSPEMKCKACKWGKCADHAIGPSCPSFIPEMHSKTTQIPRNVEHHHAWKVCWSKSCHSSGRINLQETTETCPSQTFNTGTGHLNC
jgi:hypothetical protein